MNEQNNKGTTSGALIDDHSFTVCRVGADGDAEVVCSNATSHEAASEFWHCSNSFSAVSGIVRRVSIVDDRGCTSLAWEFGRGFSYDGRTFHPRPVIDG